MPWVVLSVVGAAVVLSSSSLSPCALRERTRRRGLPPRPGALRDLPGLRVEAGVGSVVPPDVHDAIDGNSRRRSVRIDTYVVSPGG
jgi:hypothetical protein